MAGEPDPDVDWLWEGFLARGCVTLLTSQWKTGKTTLLSVLLSQLHAGGELAGRKVSPGRVVVLSEEDRMHWRMRSRRLKFGPHALAYCRPFKTNPTRDQWQAMVDELVRRREQEGLDLVVFDTLSMLLPLGTENQFDIYDILRPLEQLTSAGVAILLMHHPRKGMNLPGQAARGTGALTAYADIVMEMAFHSKSDRDDRRRHLASWSRYSATPAEMIIELTKDGRNYLERPIPDEEVDRVVEIVSQLCEAVSMPLSRSDLLMLWIDRPTPSESALYKHLERAVARGQLTRVGAGHREDPFLYAPPGLTPYVPRSSRSKPAVKEAPKVKEVPAIEEESSTDAVTKPVEPVAAMEPVAVAPEVVASRAVPTDSKADLIDDESNTLPDASPSVVDNAFMRDRGPPFDTPSYHHRE
jgi:hypothetical protein